MNSRSVCGAYAGALGVLILALVCAAPAQARESEKFKILSISGSSVTDRNVVYEPTDFGTCSFTQRERITFHSTKKTTAYAFTSKAHGRARVEWSRKANFEGNLSVVEVPGEVTISRSATYQQSTSVDPDTGEVTPGCYQEFSPVDCALERTVPATLNVGGTSGEETTYVELVVNQAALNQIDDECMVLSLGAVRDSPGLFSRGSLFKSKQKRVSDSDRTEEPVFDNETDSVTETGTIVKELTADLKRKKLRR